jgi:hypothetical protein
MNTKQREFCENRFKNGEYDLSDVEKDWAQYYKQLAYCNATDQRISLEYDGTGGGPVHPADYVLPEEPTTPRIQRRLVQEFEYRWLEEHHPELIGLYEFKPEGGESIFPCLFLLVIMGAAGYALYLLGVFIYERIFTPY